MYKRNSLRGIVVLMDIRHPMTNIDKTILQWTIDKSIPKLILLSKSDKLSSSLCNSQLKKVRELVRLFFGDIQVEMFSSLKREGIDKLRLKLETWFG